MARKRKHKKSRVSGVKRRSRMHGVGNIDFTTILGTVAGAVAGTMVNKIEFVKTKQAESPYLISGGKIALGLVLPMVAPSNMKNILSAVGTGMVTVGAIEMLKGVAPDMISGIGEDEFISVSLDGIGESVLAEDVLSGDLDVINGDLSVVNGDDYDDMDYGY